jgi:hypothetical protein
VIEVKGIIIKERGNFYLEFPVKEFARYGDVQNNRYRVTNIPDETLEEYVGKNVVISAEKIRTVPTTLEQLLVDEHGGNIYSSIRLANPVLNFLSNLKKS